MPKVLPMYLELRKQQIVDAAAACFARKGFHQTTMQDICDEAELSPGAVYRYFKSKEEIIQAMCSRGHEEDAATIENIVSQRSTQDAISELTQAFLVGIENRELCALNVELLSEARRDPVVLESLVEGSSAIRSPLTSLIEQAQAAGEINPDLDARAVARVMMGLYQGLVNQRMLEPELDALPYAEVVKTLFHGRFWLSEKQAEEDERRTSAPLKH